MRVIQWLTALVVVGGAVWGLSAITKSFQASPQRSSASGAPQSGETAPQDPEKLDYYNSNPFTISKSGPQPKAVTEETEYFFDRMPLHTTGVHEFVIRNEGEVPLKVAKGPTMCKCTISTVKDQEVPPGDEVKITVKYEPTDPGFFSQSVVIWTNDPERPSIKFNVAGNMYPEVSTNPAHGWVLGSVPLNTPATFEGWVYSGVDSQLELLEMIPSTDDITLTMEPVSAEGLEILKEDQGFDAVRAYAIRGTLAPSDVAGKIEEHVLFKTNSKQVPEVKLNISATRTGPFRIIAAGWFAGESLLRLGRCDAAAGKKSKLTVMIDSFGDELKLSDVVTEPAFLQVHLKKESTPPDSKLERYSLEVEIPAGAPKGIWHGPRKGRIQFRTNHPKVPEFEMAVELETL